MSKQSNLKGLNGKLTRKNARILIADTEKAYSTLVERALKLSGPAYLKSFSDFDRAYQEAIERSQDGENSYNVIILGTQSIQAPFNGWITKFSNIGDAGTLILVPALNNNDVKRVFRAMVGIGDARDKTENLDLLQTYLDDLIQLINDKKERMRHPLGIF